MQTPLVKHANLPSPANAKFATLPQEYVRNYTSVLSDDRVIFFRFPFFEPLPYQLPPRMEKLRCRTKYQALRFSLAVLAIADRVVGRMMEEGNGKFLALHLRFEEVRHFFLFFGPLSRNSGSLPRGIHRIVAQTTMNTLHYAPRLEGVKSAMVWANFAAVGSCKSAGKIIQVTVGV